MNSKHLGKGSSVPPITKQKIRLYSMRFCAYAQRIHLVLAAKKIPYEIVNVNLKDKPEWLFEKNPLGKVPVLELDSGEIIYESLVIADYLDETYPQTPLNSKNPMQKAKDRIFIQNYSQLTGHLFKFYFNSDEETFKSILKELEVIEKELVSRGKPYFGGDRPGLVDYMIWPWFEKHEAFKYLTDNEYVIPESKYTRLSEWKKLMKEDEAVKVSFISPENHSKYMKSLRVGSPDYEILA